MTRWGRDNELKEAPVPDRQIVKPATIDVSPPASQRQERRIHEELLVAIRLGRRAIGARIALPDFWFRAIIRHSDMADGATQISYSFGFHMHDRVVPRQASTGAAAMGGRVVRC